MFLTEEALEDALSEPTPEVVETLSSLPGDFILLGVAGKMGLSLARMIRRALEIVGNTRRVIGVSRFSSVNDQQVFGRYGIETIRCDLLDEQQVERLPEASNVIAMAGMKFGSTGNESLTWAVNAWLPSIVCRRFRSSRIVAFSTGNVYGLTPVRTGGSLETDIPAPVGEYAMSCLGRERIYEHFSRTLSIPVSLIRLNYACDLRYGVLVDIAGRIQTGQTVDLSMGHINTIWQGDANAWTLLAFQKAATPPWIINVTGPELLKVRDIAERMAGRMKRSVKFTGEESETALISNTHQAQSSFPSPRISAANLIDAVADWVLAGGRCLGKPTHFQSRDGKF